MSGKRLTDQDKNRARTMRRNGYSYHRIAERIGSTYPTVRRLLDSEYKERCKDATRARYNPKRKGPREFPRIVDVPAAVEQDREVRLALQRSLTSTIFGDPPPGYSALDHKRREQNARRG